ncbi:hypothetical protein WJX72_011534 [[Myrmecia] bisecta]|uniref:Glycosyltransferase n=1 Tax=[Myrmecia] bisecta TaxID=41462 RepID=A0AAW1PAU1_9CHLO
MAGFTTTARDDWMYRLPLFWLMHEFAEVIYVIEPYKIWGDRQVPEVGRLTRMNGMGTSARSGSAAAELAVLVPALLVVRDGPMLAQTYLRFPNLKAAAFKVLFPIGQFPPPQLYTTINYTIPDTAIVKPPSPRIFDACAGSQNTRRGRVLLYPAEVYGRKGQLEFLKALKRGRLGGWVVNFVGKLRKPDLVKQVRAMCRRKQVECHFVGQVGFPELMQYYRNASHILLMSKKDPNPRVVYEGLACNLPFVASTNVTLPDSIKGLGMQLNVKSHSFQADLLAFLQRDFGDAPYQFARERLTEQVVYPGIIQRISEAASGA